MSEFPVEVTTRYATVVLSLAEAWQFVMARVDSVGPDPCISITPRWTYSDVEAGGTRRFEVVVDGMVPEEAPDA